MEFQRFSIGARFVISGSVQDTAARAWSLLFDFLSPKEVAGLQLYGVYQEPNEIEREPAYICVLSRASLRRCKQVYARLAANPMIRSYLTLYRPFLQNNRLSVFDGYESLGRVDEAGFADMTLCPETMGKVNQLGTLDEVLTLCGVDSRITPCIDFGHLNARTLGGIQTKADYAAILDRMAEVLGDDRARQFHVHFSRIEYSAGGEKRHWTFADTQFGPEPQPLMELLAERQLTPVVICESAGTQAEDACAMQQMYRAARNA